MFCDLQDSILALTGLVLLYSSNDLGLSFEQESKTFVKSSQSKVIVLLVFPDGQPYKGRLYPFTIPVSAGRSLTAHWH